MVKHRTICYKLAITPIAIFDHYTLNVHKADPNNTQRLLKYADIYDYLLNLSRIHSFSDD